MPKIPNKSLCSWVDLSVIDEMASRLRNAGLWDNCLGDGIAVFKARVELLERFTRFEGGKVYQNIRRPLRTWDQCRKLLTVITTDRVATFSDIPAPIEACLQTAVMLERWERENKPVPTDMRGMMHGAICIEWSKPASNMILDGKGIHYTKG